MGATADWPCFADDLGLFDLPAVFVKPAVQACRLFNTLVDAIFYDVVDLVRDLKRADIEVSTLPTREKPPSRIVSFDALSNPEGSLLLIDAQTAPYVHQYRDVKAFLQSPYQEAQDVDVVTITGVGSSALGSAAFAWNVSLATGEPVLAIVPGYGVADLLQQALGGWFAFGLHDYLQSKSLAQAALASVAPSVARIGRQLSATVPDRETIRGAPVFRHGSGSSDVLHALMTSRKRPFKMVSGHSKGALVIGNGLRSLPPAATDEVLVVTLACPIATDTKGVRYHQALGVIDVLGILNMWFHLPDEWKLAWHTTNIHLALPLRAGEVVEEAITGVAGPPWRAVAECAPK